MGPDGVGFVRWWADRYTRGLPDEVGARRRAEIECDVFEQTQHASIAAGSGRAVAWRALRGVPADVAWRRQERRVMRGATPEAHGSHLRHAWAVVTQNWFAPIAVLIGVFNLGASFAVATEAEGKMPGQVIGPIIMGSLALSMFGGLWLRWRSGRRVAARPDPATRQPIRVGGRQIALLATILVLSFGLLVVGVSTGGVPIFFAALVLLGGSALVFGGRAVVAAVRSSDDADRGALAAGMIIVATLPALAFFWMVVPAVLAIAVIAGVLGTSPRVRPAA